MRVTEIFGLSIHSPFKIEQGMYGQFFQSQNSKPNVIKKKVQSHL
jgi:hypothetical protein